MGSTAGANKERKAYLVKRKLVDCGLCPYHRKENTRNVRNPREDRYKNHRRRK